MTTKVYDPQMPLVEQLLALKDPRTADWVTMKDPKYIAITILGYLYMAKIWGPRFMRDRKPYDLSRVIQCYNVFQIIANSYFCSRLFYLAFNKLNYSPFCQGLSYSMQPDSVELINTLYYYLLVRTIDFADTLFFILKKKFTHISQLHVIHHTIVVFAGWQFLRFGADGQSVLAVCLNATIHIIMYSYYFLASLGPQMQPYLWWKKYLTTIQIVQFLLMIGHALIPVWIDCGYPRVLLCVAIPQVILILGFFVNFYIQSYMTTKKGRNTSGQTETAKDQHIVGNSTMCFSMVSFEEPKKNE
ncbi:elongation of very long chain fatty acids protein AAEL008004-like [Varroa destructor]|uniref:Elongation of very long chain fatty acids protein n=1 Tax=Varroa destructor TaxID=109461 RepID=A0A7M7KZX6_VARDE|nr:elongation of very long chain fatty acids protein AAEL008004-like [Varroa destructor]